MPKFQVVSPHLPSQCLAAVEEMLAHDPEFVEEAWLGCDAGDHTVYATVDGAAPEQVRNRLPASLRSNSRVVEVGQVTPESIKAHNVGLP